METPEKSIFCQNCGKKIISSEIKSAYFLSFFRKHFSKKAIIVLLFALILTAGAVYAIPKAIDFYKITGLVKNAISLQKNGNYKAVIGILDQTDKMWTLNSERKNIAELKDKNIKYSDYQILFNNAIEKEKEGQLEEVRTDLQKISTDYPKYNEIKIKLTEVQYAIEAKIKEEAIAREEGIKKAAEEEKIILDAAKVTAQRQTQAAATRANKAAAEAQASALAAQQAQAAASAAQWAQKISDDAKASAEKQTQEAADRADKAAAEAQAAKIAAQQAQAAALAAQQAKQISDEEKATAQRQAQEAAARADKAAAEAQAAALAAQQAQAAAELKKQTLSSIIQQWRPQIAYLECDFSYSGIIYQKNYGSGTVFIWSDGTTKILTNKHIVLDDNGYGPSVCYSNFPTNVNVFKTYIDGVGVAASRDWGLLKITPDENINNVIGGRFCNTKASVGDEIVILGYPGIGSKTDITATEGIISGYDGDYYITSAKIEHGNSGGAAILVKDNCYLGIPTGYIAGAAESLGRILDVGVIYK
jgi:hypothetical protein